MRAQLLDLFDNTMTFDNFIAISNKIVVDALKQNKNQFTHITGIKLSGKTHLLKAWVNNANQQHKSATYIDIHEDSQFEEIRNLATYYQFIALDNIEYLSDNQQIELFDLFNSIKLNNRNNHLLTTTSTTIDSLTNCRNDLKTRMLCGLNLTLKVPADEEILQLLRLYTSQEGINIGDAELKYLITHYTRNIGNLINIISKIADTATLEKKNISILSIKHMINKV